MAEVTTGVDELMELLRVEGKLSLPEAAKRLRQTERTIQNWADFLVEEKLLGIEYKFTTPYLYVNQPAKVAAISKTVESIESHRDSFISRATEKGMPQDKLVALWKHHLTEAIDNRAVFFKKECQKRTLPNVEELFKRYKERSLEEYSLRI